MDSCLRRNDGAGSEDGFLPPDLVEGRLCRNDEAALPREQRADGRGRELVQRRRGIRQGSIACTTGETSRGTFRVS